MSFSSSKPLIIFDVDGTLLGGESYDWSSFEDAFLEVTGAPFEAGFFDRITEVNATAIVEQARPDLEGAELESVITAVAEGYRRRLADEIAAHPEAFPATAGACELLPKLGELGYDRAIATGDWKNSIALKLDAAGIPWRGLPMATSSDRNTRAQIISLAAERANRPVNEAIYVGDGLWDLRATASLGIPFIGTGAKHARLEAAGAEFVVPDLSPAPFLETLDHIAATANS
ncbi:MAG: HAD family hydrolase [Synoicihabitans sp.]